MAPAYSVSVSDGVLSDGPAGASVTFANVNDAPVAVADAGTLAEEGTLVLDLAGNDTDADDALDLTSIVIVGAPSHGTVTVNANGTVEYTHDGSESTADGFTYTIEDVSGAVSNVAGVTLTVTAVNDAPVLVNNALTLDEGETVVLGSGDLSATDAETNAGALVFTVSGVGSGRFEEVVSPGIAVTSFTQQQITAGEVQFVHDGSETAPTYTVTVSDGDLDDGPDAAYVTFTDINDAPTLLTNALSIDEGGTVVLDADDLSASDAETIADALSFTVSAISGGQFERIGAVGTPITSFTQQQLTDSEIRFVHDGGEAAPAYEVSVSDGVLSDGPAGASVTFTNVNDAPVAVADVGTLAEGGTLVLDLAGNDTDADDGLDLASIVIVTAPSHGTVTVNANGTVEYVHDGSESTTDGFTYTIEDASGAVSNVAGVTLTVTAVNDAPALVNNALTLEEGETVTLDAADLSATDVDTADSTLMFTVSNLSGGQFEEASGSGTPVTSFTQQQVIDGQIRFVHDGGGGGAGVRSERERRAAEYRGGGGRA